MGGTSRYTALGHETESRRDFLKILTVATGFVGLGAIVWPFIDALKPDADREARGPSHRRCRRHRRRIPP